jgi:hypothetical protein
VIVHPAAPTTLTISRPPDEARSMVGFGTSAWAEADGRLTILARGWHPREHETYAYLFNEGYPVRSPRMVRITWPAGSAAQADCRIELMAMPDDVRPGATGLPLRPWKYVGTAPLELSGWFGDRRTRLKAAKLVRVDDPSDVIRVSGALVAKTDAPGDFSHLAGMWTAMEAELTPDAAEP